VGQLYDMFLAWKGPQLHKWHHYFEVYESLLESYRHKPLNFLEIGLWKGGSLDMWRQYFGDQAMIAGCDIKPACEKYAEHGFKIFIGDQSDPAFLNQMLDQLPVLDVVIDDGGHTASQQITSFEAIYPRMNPSGLYIVEDTHTSYWDDFKDRADGQTFVEYAKKLCDLLTAWHFQRDSFQKYGIPPHRRTETPEVPAFTRSTRSISFFDSMVVFHRAPVQSPWHQIKP
jgi:cephalosporin hydroxylase